MHVVKTLSGTPDKFKALLQLLEDEALGSVL